MWTRFVLFGFFWLHPVALGSVLQPGIEPEPWQGKPGILTTKVPWSSLRFALKFFFFPLNLWFIWLIDFLSFWLFWDIGQNTKPSSWTYSCPSWFSLNDNSTCYCTNASPLPFTVYTQQGHLELEQMFSLTKTWFKANRNIWINLIFCHNYNFADFFFLTFRLSHHFWEKLSFFITLSWGHNTWWITLQNSRSPSLSYF